MSGGSLHLVVGGEVTAVCYPESAGGYTDLGRRGALGFTVGAVPQRHPDHVVGIYTGSSVLAGVEGTMCPLHGRNRFTTACCNYENLAPSEDLPQDQMDGFA